MTIRLSGTSDGLIPVVTTGDGTWTTTRTANVPVNGHVIKIQKSFKTDLASIPRVFRGLVNTYELGGIVPPLVHDAVYRGLGDPERMKALGVTVTPAVTRITRRAADRMFRELMLLHNVGRIRRTVAWSSVRLFGWIPWPPSKTTLRNVTTRAGHTMWQAGLATGLVVWSDAPLWLIPFLGGLLSAVKTLVQRTPLAEQIKGVLY